VADENKEKPIGHNIIPAHSPTDGLDREPTDFRITDSSAHIVRVDDSGQIVEVADNPLAIHDPTKRDDSAVFARRTMFVSATCLLLGDLCASFYAQVIAVPHTTFNSPPELIAIIVGIYTGASWNMLVKAWGTWQDFRNKGAK
jgi:hypothetical protein